MMCKNNTILLKQEKLYRTDYWSVPAYEINVSLFTGTSGSVQEANLESMVVVIVYMQCFDRGVHMTFFFFSFENCSSHHPHN